MKRRSLVAAVAGIVLLPGWAAAQSLALSSGTVPEGTPVVLSLFFNTPTGLTQPAAIQWTFSYSTAAVANLAVAPGPILSGANKFLTCNADPQAYVCVIAGYTLDTIPNGVVATATVTFAPGASSATVSLDNQLAASNAAAALPLAATGGTATVIPPSVTGLNCTISTLSSNGSTTCTVTISEAALVGGAIVSLSDSASQVLTVPTSVTVPVGATTAAFTISAGTVSANQTATLTATLNGTATVNVTLELPPTPTSLSCILTTLTSNQSTTCTVNLSQPGLPGGTVVPLTNSASPVLAVPATVTVAAGTMSATFNISTGTVAANQTASLTATLNGATASTSVTVEPPPTPASLTCTLTTLTSNQSTTCTVNLSQPALPGGTVVALTNSASPVLAAPTSVTAVAGATTATFSISTGTVAANQTANLTATVNGVTASTSVALEPPPTPTSLSCTLTTLTSNQSTMCTVHLSQQGLPGGTAVALTNSAAPMLAAPTTVTVPAGATAGTFSVSTGTVAANQTASLTATLNEATASTSIVLEQPPTPTSLSCALTTLTSNQSTMCTLTLSQPGLPGGTVVALTNTASPVLAAPASVTVNAGATTGTFSISTGTVSTNQTATLSATLDGATAPTTVTLEPPPTATSLSCTLTTLSSNQSTMCTVRLSQPGLPGGTVVALTNSGSPVLAAPASVTVIAGATTGTFSISTGTVPTNQTATLTAAINGTTASTNVVLQPLPVPASFSCTLTTLTSNQGTTCTVSLSQPALPGGAVVTLGNNASPVLAVPASVSVNAGATAGTFSISTGTVASNRTATLTATLNGATASASILLEPPPMPTGLSCGLTLLSTSQSTTCSVSLSQPGLPGGTVVTLTNSASPVLAAPGSVTVSAGATTATFSISTGTVSVVQTAMLGATANGATATANISLYPPVGISFITCAASALLAQTYTTCTVNLTEVVPPGTTASIILSSNNPALTVSSPLAVSGGSSSGQFRAQAGTFSAGSTATITATLNGSSQTFPISLSLAVLLSSLNCTPSTVAAGGSGSCTANLTSPSIGVSTMTLTSSNPVLVVPANVAAANGQSSINFNFTTGKTATGWVIITATLGTSSLTAVITISSEGTSPNVSVAPGLRISCESAVLVAGRKMKCAIQLDRPSESASMEALVQTSSASLRVPAKVGARVGQRRLVFEIVADSGASFETAVLEARIGSQSAQTAVAVDPADSPVLTVPVELGARPGAPVHFIVTAGDGKGLHVALAATGLPRGTSFDAETGAFDWTPAESDLGLYRITFTATNTLGVTTAKTLKLLVDSGSPHLTRLENGAGSDAPAGCSPGAMATVRGNWLFAGAVPAADESGASTQLGGTRVLINGDYAPILYASADRVDLLCPNAAAGTAMTLAVETPDGRSNLIEGRVQPSTPGLFTISDSEAARAWAVRSGTSELASIPSDRVNGKPAFADDVLVFRATGIDCAAESAVVGLSMEIGGDVIPVNAVRPALGHAGICEVAVVVPPSAAGDEVPVTLQATGPDGVKRKSNATTVAVAFRP